VSPALASHKTHVESGIVADFEVTQGILLGASDGRSRLEDD
jgi:hypothetical protein